MASDELDIRPLRNIVGYGNGGTLDLVAQAPMAPELALAREPKNPLCEADGCLPDR